MKNIVTFKVVGKTGLRSADSMLTTIDIYEKRVFFLEKKKHEEADPEKLSVIQSEINKLGDQIATLRIELDKRRTPIGSEISIGLVVQ